MFRVVTLGIGAIAGLVLGLAPPRPSEPPAIQDLLEAYQRGDLATLEARAHNVSAADLRPKLALPTPELAAIWAAPAVADPEALLGDLARVAAHWHPHVAAIAAANARTIARALTAEMLDEREFTGSEFAAALTAWAALAADRWVRNDVRVLATETALALAAAAPTSAAREAARAPIAAALEALRTSADPELSRIAADLEGAP